MINPRWPVVIFDLDGTLANTIPLILASYTHAVGRVLGRQVDPEEGRGWIGRTLIDAFTDFAPDHADELVATYTDWNLANLDRLVEPYPGMDSLLADLAAAGIRIGIATSKRQRSALETLRAVGLTGAVPVLVSMEDTVEHKPRPEPLLAAVAALGARPEQAVYVGDAVVDVRAAKAAGLAAIALTWGAGTAAELAAEQPDLLLGSVDELRVALLGGSANLAGPARE